MASFCRDPELGQIDADVLAVAAVVLVALAEPLHGYGCAPSFLGPLVLVLVLVLVLAMAGRCRPECPEPHVPVMAQA